MRLFDVFRRVQWLPVSAVVLWLLSVVLAVVGVDGVVVGAVAAGGVMLAVLFRGS